MSIVDRVVRGVLILASAYTAWQIAAYFQRDLAQRHRVESAWFIYCAIVIACVMTSRDRPCEDSSGHPEWAGWAALCVTFALVLYWPAIGLGLLADDFVFVGRSATSQLLPGEWEFYRPLPLIWLRAAFSAGGATALHFGNILLHGLNSALLLALATRLGHDRLTAVAAASIFLFFPAAVEAVAWSSGIFDLGVTTLTLVFLLIIVTNSEQVFMPVCVFAAALLTKETAVAGPLLVAALSWRVPVRKRLIAASVSICLAYILCRWLFGVTLTNMEINSGRYLAKEMLIRPFASLATPWNREELLTYESLGVMPALGLLGLISAYAFSPRLRWKPFMPAVWVLIGALPVGALFYISDDLRGSRYLYLPLCGWSLMLGDLLSNLRPQMRRVASATVVIAALTVGSWGVRRHLADWVAAAAMRDVVLAAAYSASGESRCDIVAFQNVPGSVRGAHVFINGFAEALMLTRGIRSSGVGSEVRHGCTFTWNGSSFEPVKY